jgi:5-methylcytosine-specific restriction endonuclease McrA
LTGRTVSCGCAIAGRDKPARAAYIRIEHASYYSARKRGGKGDYTKEDIAALFVKQRGCCAICKKRTAMANMHRDHIEPIKSGGLNVLANIQLLCLYCNASKGAKDPVAFMQSKGYLL